MNKKIHKFNVNGIDILLQDIETSETLCHIKNEVFINDEYKLNEIEFQDNDIVLDIGANVGSVSILLAKKYPQLKIYSFEPHPINFKNFLQNIELNNVNNIIPIQKAVSKNSNVLQELSLCYTNTGSTSLFKSNTKSKGTYMVNTISLDDIINEFYINEIKFLKIDCEGSEFDILEHSAKIRNIPIHNLSVEIHTFVEPLGKETWVKARQEEINNIRKKGDLEKAANAERKLFNETEASVDGLVKLCEEISINKPLCKIYNLG